MLASRITATTASLYGGMKDRPRGALLSLFLPKQTKRLAILPPITRRPLLTPIKAKSPLRRRRRRYTTLRFSSLLRRLVNRMLSSLTGFSVYMLICRNLQKRLSTKELAFVWMQAQRIFLRMPANLSTARRLELYPWRYGSMALYTSTMVKDPRVLVNWLQSRIRTMTLFQHRRFFRTLALTLRVACSRPRYRYALRGFRLLVVGKISVTGNAMSRTYSAHAGMQSNSSLRLRMCQAFTLIRTRTGCLGVTIGYYH